MSHYAIRFLTIAVCLTLWAQVALAKPARHFRTLRGHKNFIIQISAASKAKVMVSVSDSTARLWKLPGGQKQAQIKASEDETFGVIAVGPEGKHVAISVGTTIRLYSVKRYKAVKLHVLKGHAKDITALAFDKAGTTLASSADGVRLWNLTGKEIAKIATDKQVSDVRFSPASGEIVAVLKDGVHFYGRNSFKEARKIAQKELFRVSFSDDGKQMAAVGTSGTLTLFNAAGKKVWSKDKLAAETFVGFAAGGKLVLSAFRGNKIIAHDAKTGTLKWTINGKEGMSVLTIKDKVLATGGGEGRIWLWKL